MLVPIKSTIEKPTPTFIFESAKILQSAKNDVLQKTDEVCEEEKSASDFSIISAGEANSFRVVEIEVEETEKSSVNQSIFSFGDGLLPQQAAEQPYSDFLPMVRSDGVVIPPRYMIKKFS